MKTLLAFLFLFLTPQLQANCELSWAGEWDDNSNWLHTVAERDSSERFSLGHIRRLPGKRLEIKFQNDTGSSCSEVSEIFNGKKTHCTDELKNIKCNYDESGFYSYFRFKSCKGLSIEGRNSTFYKTKGNGQLNLVKKVKLKETNLDTSNERLTSAFHNSSYKKYKIGGKYSNLEVNLTKLKPLNIKKYSHPESNLTFYSFNVEFLLSEVEGLCGPDKTCESPDTKISVPIVLYENGRGGFEVFATPQIGSCTPHTLSYKEENKGKNLEEVALKQSFYSIHGFWVWTNDELNDEQVFEIAPRYIFPDEKFIYQFKQNKIFFRGEYCDGPEDKCRPAAGC
jgi:hypothetical protein